MLATTLQDTLYRTDEHQHSTLLIIDNSPDIDANKVLCLKNVISTNKHSNIGYNNILQKHLPNYQQVTG